MNCVLDKTAYCIMLTLLSRFASLQLFARATSYSYAEGKEANLFFSIAAFYFYAAGRPPARPAGASLVGGLFERGAVPFATCIAADIRRAGAGGYAAAAASLRLLTPIFSHRPASANTGLLYISKPISSRP